MDLGEAFNELFEEHASQILAFALRRAPSRDEAEDVAAETFAVAWRRRETLPDDPLPWLYGIAANVIRNQQRSLRRRSRLTRKLSAEPPVVGLDPAGGLADRDEFAAAFARLSESQCEVLRLVAWEGLGAREAATVLGCTESAFKVRLHRARHDLAKQMGEAGHERTEMKSAAKQRLKEEL